MRRHALRFAQGVGEFVYFSNVPPVGAGYITATATSMDGDTSEFSNAVETIDWPSFVPGIYLLDLPPR